MLPPLLDCLEEYCEWLHALDPPLDPWRDVLLVDDQQRDPVPVPPHAFMDRWHEIVSTVDRSWVNFTCVGSRDGVLVVAVEWKPPAVGTESWPVHPIFVNWSGPPWKFGDDGRPTGGYLENWF